jgi:hypothetical protein
LDDEIYDGAGDFDDVDVFEETDGEDDEDVIFSAPSDSKNS